MLSAAHRYSTRYELIRPTLNNCGLVSISSANPFSSLLLPRRWAHVNLCCEPIFCSTGNIEEEALDSSLGSNESLSPLSIPGGVKVERSRSKKANPTAASSLFGPGSVCAKTLLARYFSGNAFYTVAYIHLHHRPVGLCVPRSAPPSPSLTNDGLLLGLDIVAWGQRDAGLGKHSADWDPSLPLAPQSSTALGWELEGQH